MNTIILLFLVGGIVTVLLRKSWLSLATALRTAQELVDSRNSHSGPNDREELAVIMNRLGRPYSVGELSALVVSQESSDVKQAETELIDYVCSNQETQSILNHYGTNRADLQEYYTRLSGMGLGQWVGENYVSVAAIAYPEPLDFVLEAATAQLPDGWSDKDRWMSIAAGLRMYFATGSFQLPGL